LPARSPLQCKESLKLLIDALRASRSEETSPVSGTASPIGNAGGASPENAGVVASFGSRKEAPASIRACSSYRVDVRAAAFGMCHCGAAQAAHSAEARQNDKPDRQTTSTTEIGEKVQTFQNYIASTSDGGSHRARPYKPVGHRMEPQEQPTSEKRG
jgi:hypothetical protein